MSKICYMEKRFNASSEIVIKQADKIIREYDAKGFTLTLRQLYYQFVARDLMKNSQNNYRRLGSIINDARLAGFIDWEAIEDRTRNLQGNTHWQTPTQIMEAISRSFRMDHWEGQEFRIEVWIEKEALVGVIEQICKKLDVDFFACRGYVSQSEMWRASQRMQRSYMDNDQMPVIIHLGDLDPSGVDMTRDIDNRDNIFRGSAIIERIALNMDQVEEYNPPPNPAKITDSRFQSFSEKYGNNSWELDALDPEVIEGLIENVVTTYRNDDIYQNVLAKEAEYKSTLAEITEKWHIVDWSNVYV